MAEIQNKDASMRKTLEWAAAGVGLFLAANTIYHELTKFNVKNKVILITGGSRGLGLVLARELAAKGAKLAICARSADRLELARQELSRNGAQVIAMTVDVTVQDEVNTMINDVVNAFGRIDVVINNAGIIQVGPQEKMDIHAYEQAMKTNFWAPLYSIHAALPHFIKQRQGRIVNIASIGGKIAMPHMLPYTSSKFALVGLSEGMHAELKKYNIHVTTIIPNLMNTGSPRNIDLKGDHEAEYAWFKTSDAMPGLTQDPVQAARRIIRALEYGESEAILTFTAKFATFIKGLAPGWVNTALALTNSLLPKDIGEGNVTLKGFEAESKASQNPVARLSDKASSQNNER